MTEHTSEVVGLGLGRDVVSEHGVKVRVRVRVRE